ncbi:MAG TPA: Kdo hydroxylase family protein [Gemmataceae bacterium]|jgi:hypothetical protein|nr:Kdo hydroxylase family protein [Gemmataceae bacterium]
MAASTGSSIEERLERGEVEYFPVCPFAVPAGDDRAFLLTQTLGNRAHKNVSYHPRTGKAAGFTYHSAEQAERLRRMLADFSRTATGWLSSVLPRYAGAWRLDQVSFRPVEEATRKLRQKARNDLIHVDAFPSRPTNGDRILRLFVNVNPTEPRIWATSEPFGRLLERFGAQVGLPAQESAGLSSRIKGNLFRLFHPGQPARSAYDSFMLRFHDFLKANDEFQEKGPKRFWTFAPGSAWLALTDVTSHAALRGRYALEHSYFIAPHCLALPEESPAALLQRACGFAVLNKAA